MISLFRKKQNTDEGHESSNVNTGGLPTPAAQMWIVYNAQMKLYMKGSTPFVLVFLVLLIPAIVYTGILDSIIIDSMREEVGNTGEGYMAICLSMLSVMTALIASMICGSILPSEIRYRTAYLNFPFPQSRRTFYFGKFLAGYTLVLATVLAAFAISIMMASMQYSTLSFTAAGSALLLSMAGSFAFCAITYGISTYMERGSTMLPFALIFIVIPVIGLVLADTGVLAGAVGYIPSFFGEVALSYLGSDQSVSMMMLLEDINVDITAPFIGAFIVNVVCGIVFLIAGLVRTERREI